jgi:prefoldin subunit 5
MAVDLAFRKIRKKLEQLESKLKIIDAENSRLVIIMKEKEETIEFIQNKCDTLEDTLKAERRKS